MIRYAETFFLENQDKKRLRASRFARLIINCFFFRVFAKISRFRENFTICSILCRVLLNFVLPGKNTEKFNSRIADKSPTKQNIGQAHGMSPVRRVSPPPTLRDRPGSSLASFPGHGWSQKAPCIARAPFVQPTEPTHRHR